MSFDPSLVSSARCLQETRGNAMRWHCATVKPFLCKLATQNIIAFEIGSALKFCTDVLSTARKVVFLGYSMPTSDIHAQFITRCGFHNQKEGKLFAGGNRTKPTGPAEVVIVNPIRTRSAAAWRRGRLAALVARRTS